MKDSVNRSEAAARLLHGALQLVRICNVARSTITRAPSSSIAWSLRIVRLTRSAFPRPQPFGPLRRRRKLRTGQEHQRRLDRPRQVLGHGEPNLPESAGHEVDAAIPEQPGSRRSGLQLHGLESLHPAAAFPICDHCLGTSRPEFIQQQTGEPHRRLSRARVPSIVRQRTCGCSCGITFAAASAVAFPGSNSSVAADGAYVADHYLEADGVHVPLGGKRLHQRNDARESESLGTIKALFDGADVGATPQKSTIVCGTPPDALSSPIKLR